MKTSLAIVLTAAALMLGATVSLTSGAAVAHHNVYHSLGQCGSITWTWAKTCAGTEQRQVPTTTRRRR
jgi:hypothetical protein